jgi:uncharacterized membrane protein (UPF0127 family)
MLCVVRNLTRGTMVADRARCARSMLSRMRGLIGRRELASGEGLVLTPCSGIHMFWMRIPLDVVFLNRHNQVICAVSGLPTWTMLPWVRGATSAVELPIGTVHETRTAPGDLMSIEHQPGASAERIELQQGTWAAPA